MKSNEKNTLRQEMLKRRNSIKEKEVQDLSHKIMTSLMMLSKFKESKTIMIYLSFKNEVDTSELIDYCRRENKRLVVPYTVKNEKKIIPTELKNPQKELVLSGYGYMEPRKEALRPVLKKEIDIVIVPGLVFDKRCQRIGFGGGYYDRFLPELGDDTVTAAVAYDFQIVDRVPTEPFDIPLDYVITDKRMLVR